MIDLAIRQAVEQAVAGSLLDVQEQTATVPLDAWNRIVLLVLPLMTFEGRSELSRDEEASA